MAAPLLGEGARVVPRADDEVTIPQHDGVVRHLGLLVSECEWDTEVGQHAPRCRSRTARSTHIAIGRLENLVSCNPRNVRFYERNGFISLGAVKLSGMTITLMVRPDLHGRKLAEPA